MREHKLYWSLVCKVNDLTPSYLATPKHSCVCKDNKNILTRMLQRMEFLDSHSRNFRKFWTFTHKVEWRRTSTLEHEYYSTKYNI